jgi:hypothetical protein
MNEEHTPRKTNHRPFARISTALHEARWEQRTWSVMEKRTCDTTKTWSAHQGTRVEGLRTPEERIVIVVIVAACGCPVQALVHALGLDERTVARGPGAGGSTRPEDPGEPGDARKAGSAPRARG